ncbi:hypothetical protein SASPL_155628 [Salvia splendens]|uniref:Aspartate/glutamate/uridylate kinase domain-containing protein n=1 Tax=Salvia splendens TaxID=180675 RepID=A0A8X8VYA2_SALSN|nr:hypothetical protein SASPL_155628 [Salvia splendens]
MEIKFEVFNRFVFEAVEETMLAVNIRPISSPLPAVLENSSSFALSRQNAAPLAKFKPSRISTSLRSSLQSIVAPEVDQDFTSAQTRVKILSEALPFIQKFRGKTIVVKYGGAAMKSEALQASVIADWLGKLNIEPNFLNGLRVTDASTMEIVSMVLVGKVNKQLVALINKAGGTALGFVGDIASVDPTIIRPLIDNNHLPVIASVAADATGQAYNINADTAAGELAAALGAEKLILLTDVAGILEDRNDPESLVREIDIKGVKKMIEEGTIAGGMIPKVNCCVRSLAQGVRTTSIIDGRLKHSLLLEILTDEGAGTMITG